MDFQERIAKIKESQKTSEDLLLNLIGSLEKTNEEQEELSTEIDDLLRLQNDSHYTIGGVIREKLEDIEEKNGVFREQLESSTTEVSENLQKELETIEEKFSESERVISNMAKEVSLLKIGVNLMKNTISERDSETVDDHKTNGEIPMERETISKSDEKISIDSSVSKEKKATAEEENMTKEEVLQKKLDDEYKWMKNRVSIVSDGVKMENGLVVPLQRFLHLAKNRPDELFPAEKYQLECNNCQKKTVFHPDLVIGYAHPCCNCQSPIVLGDPPENSRYILTNCGHLNIASDAPVRCSTCSDIPTAFSDAPIANQISYMKRVEMTEEEVLDNTLKHAHLKWMKEKIHYDDFEVQIPSGSCMNLSSFTKIAVCSPWSFFPREFVVDCYSCGKILSMYDADGLTVICSRCSQTTVAVPMRFSAKQGTLVKYACGHYSERREDHKVKYCFDCGVDKIVPHSKKNVRVMWRKGTSKEETWDPYFLMKKRTNESKATQGTSKNSK